MWKFHITSTHRFYCGQILVCLDSTTFEMSVSQILDHGGTPPHISCRSLWKDVTTLT